jgi:hypothetical protein
MKKITFVALCVGLSPIMTAQINPNKVVNNAYLPNESLTYSLHCGWIEGGRCYLTVKEEEFENKKVYHAVAMGVTTGLADNLYGVKDIFESYYDPATGLPVKKIRNIKEHNYRFYNEARFNRTKNTVTSLKSGEKPAPEYIFDLVSVFYHLRCLEINKLKNGDVVKTIIFVDDRIFPFDIRYRGTEVIKTDQGYIKCHKFLPYTEPGSVFKEDDDMTMWFSADSNMIPIRISIQMWVVTFDCDLIEYKNIKRPLPFSEKKPK